jgi:hypothetical protein
VRKKLMVAGIGAAAAIVGSSAAFAAAPGTNQGPSSSLPPVLVRTQPGIVTTSILTTGDKVGGYTMAGIPDGLGAYDNGDGTFTVLMNHEIPGSAGAVRAHGGTGAFVSKWRVDSTTLEVLEGSDLIESLYAWNGTAWVEVTADTPAGAAALRFSRFCSADLPEVSAFYDAASGKGTTERIFMNGEETGAEGRAIGTVVTGEEAGDAYDLPWLGKFSWENSVAKPGYGEKTAVVGLDDSGGGQVYVYVGEKQTSGNDVEKAGLADGTLYGLRIDGVPTEGNGTGGAGFSASFSLVDLGDVSGLTGAQLETLSNSRGVSKMNRPEDGSWDPSDPSNFYFGTTASFTGISRLWNLDFTDPSDLTKGGTATVEVASPPYDPGKSPDPVQNSLLQAGPRMIDNLTVNSRGQVVFVEDVGNQAYIGGVWQFDPSTGALAKIAQHDPALFTPGAPGFITQDEEASGVIPVPFLGAGKYLIDSQIHKPTGDPLTVEEGQLLLLQIPPGRPVR